MHCCIHCFNDYYIKEKIKSEGTLSVCDYCGEENVHAISIGALADDFENLFSIYEQTTHGEHYAHQVHCPTDFGDLLDVLIQDDWSIFSDETSQNLLLFDILNWNRSLEDVLDDSELYSKQENAFTFVSSSDVWNAFAYSIKRENRYFPDHDLSNELGLLIQNKLITFRTNHNFYRARIGNFPVGKMGPPPVELATPGRVNPKGIPYLYVASDEFTCIAETRPWVGAEITVATIKPKEAINIIDLSSKEFLKSPFLADDLSHSIQANKLLNHLSYELSKPVSPDESYIEYIPSQYLAELIKKLGYDGLKYKSSLGTGENFVFFHPDKFEYVTTALRKVSFVGYEYR